MRDEKTLAAEAAFYAHVFDGTKLGRSVWLEARSLARRADRRAGLWSTTTEPVNIFEEIAAPPFPRHVLPEAWQRQARDFERSSGFDGGAFLFLKMAHAGSILDHRARLQVTDSWKSPPFHWAAIVDASGGGKSPTIAAAGRDAMRIYGEIVAQSARNFAEWKKNSDEGATFSFRQRHADDTTIEALAKLLESNCDGVTLALDELTGWLGRMDAYSGGGVQSKDRPAWLDAWSSRENRPINRAGKQLPLIVPHWAAAVIGGLQPEMLAQQFKRTQSGGDGLVQRFMLYHMAKPKDADLFHQEDMMAAAAVGACFDRLPAVAVDREGKPLTFVLRDEAKALVQDYVSNMRTITSRTRATRFAEHLNKFPGFLLRIALTLHCIRLADAPDTPSPLSVGVDAVRDAERVMLVLYRHSEAVYAVLDQSADEVRNLMLSAAEAILSKGWTAIQRGDLTRYANGWRGANARDAEAAIDLLIELGWMSDVTTASRAGRGRRSEGKWRVNPDVHIMFAEQSERISDARNDRYEAIKRAAADRG